MPISCRPLSMVFVYVCVNLWRPLCIVLLMQQLCPCLSIKTPEYSLWSKYSCCNIVNVYYPNDPKFSDRQVCANSADPDQTAPRGAVWSGSSLFAIPLASFWWNTLRFGLFVWILGRLQQSFLESENLGTLQYVTYWQSIQDLSISIYPDLCPGFYSYRSVVHICTMHNVCSWFCPYPSLHGFIHAVTHFIYADLKI